MAKQLSTIEKVKRSFAPLGIEMENKYGIHEFEYNHMSYYLEVDDELDVFWLSQVVVSCSSQPLTEQVFADVIEITKKYHNDIVGKWTDECLPILASVPYSFNGKAKMSQKAVKSALQKFSEAYFFIECNLFLIVDMAKWKRNEKKD